MKLPDCFERTDQKLLAAPWSALAFLWGFAEATFFFIVPDVGLSAISRKKLTGTVFKAVGCAILGAILGGMTMYFLGKFQPEKSVAILDAVPGIGPPLLARVERQVSAHGLLALAIGLPRGIPYKIYATRWGMEERSLWLLGLMTIPVRGLRFLLTVVVTRGICFVAEKRVPKWEKTSLMILILFWIVFYGFYFLHFGW